MHPNSTTTLILLLLISGISCPSKNYTLNQTIEVNPYDQRFWQGYNQGRSEQMKYNYDRNSQLYDAIIAGITILLGAVWRGVGQGVQNGVTIIVAVKLVMYLAPQAANALGLVAQPAIELTKQAAIGSAVIETAKSGLWKRLMSKLTNSAAKIRQNNSLVTQK